MSASHQWSFSLKRDEGTLSIKETSSPASSVEVVQDLAIAASTSRQPVAVSITTAKVQSLLIRSDKAATLYVNGTSEVQQVAITGTPTGGTFTLTYSGQTTAAIPYNATALQVQTALAALSNVGAAQVSCSGGPLPGTPVQVAWAGTLAIQDVATMTHTDSLTGGTTPAVAITTPTPGVAPTQTIALAAGIPIIWLSDWLPFYACPLTPASVALLSFTNATTAQANVTARILSTP